MHSINTLLYITFALALLSFGCATKTRSTTPITTKPKPEIKIISISTTYPTDEAKEQFDGYRKFNGDTVKQGHYIMWNQSGVKVMECDYVKDKREGVCRSWYPNGKPESEVTYIHEQMNGVMSWWNESGEMQSEVNYKNGVKDGSQKLYYDNGKIKFDGTFIDGIAHGSFHKFHPNGDLASKGEYDHGKLLFEIAAKDLERKN